MVCIPTFTALELYSIAHVSVLYACLTSYIYGWNDTPSPALTDQHINIVPNKQVGGIMINNSTVVSGFKSSGEQSETACDSPLLLLVFVQSAANTNFVFSSVVSFHVVSPE